MAFLISFTDESDVSHTDAYIVIRDIHTRPSQSEPDATMRVMAFKNRTVSKDETKKHLDSAIFKMFIDNEDYDIYLPLSNLNPIGQNPQKALYTFLQTIDPDEAGTKYPNVLDFKNDSLASLTEVQRDKVFDNPQEGDKVYNETTSKKQTYTSGAWADD